MAKISIIKPDTTVTVDGLGYDSLDVSSVASNIHAIQFDTSTNTGHIEYNDGAANEDIVSIAAYQSIVDAHGTQKTSDETAATDAANAQAALEATYGDKRSREYPDIFDYLDGIVKGDTAQVDAYKAACQAVKDKYPK